MKTLSRVKSSTMTLINCADMSSQFNFNYTVLILCDMAIDHFILHSMFILFCHALQMKIWKMRYITDKNIYRAMLCHWIVVETILAQLVGRWFLQFNRAWLVVNNCSDDETW